MKNYKKQLFLQRCRTKWLIILLMCTVLFSMIALTGCKSASKKESPTLGEYLGSEKPSW